MKKTIIITAMLLSLIGCKKKNVTPDVVPLPPTHVYSPSVSIWNYTSSGQPITNPDTSAIVSINGITYNLSTHYKVRNGNDTSIVSSILTGWHVVNGVNTPIYSTYTTHYRGIKDISLKSGGSYTYNCIKGNIIVSSNMNTGSVIVQGEEGVLSQGKSLTQNY